MDNPLRSICSLYISHMTPQPSSATTLNSFPFGSAAAWRRNISSGREEAVVGGPYCSTDEWQASHGCDLEQWALRASSLG